MNTRHLFRFSALRFLLLTSLFFLAGCRGEGPVGDQSLVMGLSLSPTPPTVGPARLIISLQDTAGFAILGAEIVAEGNMTHAGMVPVRERAQMVGPGHYSVGRFNFTMAGDWVLTLDATLLDGRTTRLRKATRVVGAPPGFDPSGPQGDTTGEGL
jgi:hypothetical protein